MQMKLDFYEYFSWEFPWLFRNQESVFVKNRDFSISTFRNELVFYLWIVKRMEEKIAGFENEIQFNSIYLKNQIESTKQRKSLKKSSRINKNWFLKT